MNKLLKTTALTLSLLACCSFANINSVFAEQSTIKSSQTLQQQDEINDYIHAWKDIVNKNDKDLEGFASLSVLYYDKDDYNNSYKAIKRAMNLHANYEYDINDDLIREAMVKGAVSAYKLGKLSSSESILKKMLDLDLKGTKENLETYNGMAYYYLAAISKDRGYYNQSYVYIDSALYFCPNDYIFLDFRSGFFFIRGGWHWRHSHRHYVHYVPRHHYHHISPRHHVYRPSHKHIYRPHHRPIYKHPERAVNSPAKAQEHFHAKAQNYKPASHSGKPFSNPGISVKNSSPKVHTLPKPTSVQSTTSTHQSKDKPIYKSETNQSNDRQSKTYQRPIPQTRSPQQGTYQRPIPQTKSPQQGTYQRPIPQTRSPQQGTYQRPTSQSRGSYHGGYQRQTSQNRGGYHGGHTSRGHR